jgi:mono/diheme cytochrome c family protein
MALSRRSLVIFGVFAAIFAVGIPFLLIDGEGSQGGSPAAVAAKYKDGQRLFATNCGTCHTLDKAEADGVVGPNLDVLLGSGTPAASRQRVINAVTSGINGRMPKGILQGDALNKVADFVANNAGQ